MAKKLTTEEIMKMARAKQAGESEGADAPAEAAADSAPAEPVKAAAAPKGPADIMAAIRAKSAGGAAEEASGEPAAKPAAAAAPKGPADIMAAIRGKGAGAAPAAAKPAAKKATTDVPAGDLPPVGEMLAQMKAGKKPEVAAAAEAPAKPTLKRPTRPAPRVVPTPTRRAFLLDALLSPFALAWTLLAATGGAWVLMLARFMFPNMIVEPPTSFKIGPPSDFPLGTVSTKYTAANGIWIVHTDQYNSKDLIYVLASVCTHLGCTPSWLEGEQKFKCPCHGSGFYINGINFEGPAPRPLERVGVALSSDGKLEVDKAVKFQQEKGQWEDAKSFVDGSIA
jgi:cytochrome b6-f complex iron-sulfur subunit